jgi:hypothetical protein
MSMINPQELLEITQSLLQQNKLFYTSTEARIKDESAFMEEMLERGIDTEEPESLFSRRSNIGTHLPAIIVGYTRGNLLVPKRSMIEAFIFTPYALRINDALIKELRDTQKIRPGVTDAMMRNMLDIDEAFPMMQFERMPAPFLASAKAVILNDFLEVTDHFTLDNAHALPIIVDNDNIIGNHAHRISMWMIKEQ